jgi:hypothetical protein
MKAFRKKFNNVDMILNSKVKYQNEFNLDKKNNAKMPVLFKDAFMV